jgi:Fe-S cluster assembly scaffold protein SufB
MSELDDLKRTLPMVGAEPSVLDDPHIAHVVGHSHQILSHRTVPGLHFDFEERPDVIAGQLVVEPGVHIAQPIHMCFGLAHETGVQRININVKVGNEAHLHVIAHCLFPVARNAHHQMSATMTIGDGASLTYTEGHYHGPYGGIRVVPHAAIRVGRGARYFSDFSVLSGSVGALDLDYLVDVEEDGVTELTAKVFGRQNDRIQVKEAIALRGTRSRSLIKTRVVLEQAARAEITGITEAYAAGARGHVDCMEIVQGQAHASAIPIVRVFHPEAKVTHEAAIGSVNKQELETLMARGLSPEQAVELIVSGILR